MKGWTVKLLALAVPCLLAGLVVYGGAPPAPPKSDDKQSPAGIAPPARGSSEAVQESPITFFDALTGRPCAIYESIHAPKRYYLSPLLHVIPWDQSKKYAERKVASGREFSFLVLNYHPGLEKQAMAALAKHKIETEALNPLVVSMVTFSIPNFPAATVDSIGEVGTRLHLGMAPTVITVKVPQEEAAAFRALADSDAGLTVSAKAFFNAIELRRASVEVTVEDLHQTRGFKDVSTSGRHYVTAGQVHDIFHELQTNSKFREYHEDPELAAELHRCSETFFNKMLGRLGEQHIRSVEEALALNARLLRGTGIDARDHLPVLTMMRFLEAVSGASSYSEANQRAKRFAASSDTKAGLNLGAGFGPFTLSLGSSRNWGRIDEHMFSSQKEWQAFRAEYSTREGQLALVVGRGLKLVEAATLRSNISLAASQVVLRPLGMAGSITVLNATGKDQLAKKAKLIAELARLEKCLEKTKVEIAAQLQLLNSGRADLEKIRPKLVEYADARLSARGNIDHQQGVVAGRLDALAHRKIADAGWVDLDKRGREPYLRQHQAEYQRASDGFEGELSLLGVQTERIRAAAKRLEELNEQLVGTQADLDKVKDRLARRLW